MLDLLFSLLVSAAPAATSVPAPAPVADTAAPADPAPSNHKRKPPVLPPSFPVSPLRKLMQAQLDSAPRDDGKDGLSAAEAEAVMAHYLASIGKPLNTDEPGQHR
jgi:hypothetical protein